MGAMRKWLIIVIALLVAGGAGADVPDRIDAPEVTVCGAIRERLAFWSWSRVAGSADPARAAAVPGAEAVAHVTRDGRRLAGYRLPSAAPDGVTRRTVLVVGGNAMLADQILGELTVLSNAGLEVFVFDYRGYGASEGRSRLLAIIGDQVELARRLADEGQGPLAFWGISMGGIVLANALPHLRDEEQPGRFVIDGSPARIAGFGCPPAFDPVANLPPDTSGMLFVGGDRDTVVPVSTSRELIEAIEAGGGQAVVRPDFAHPFMDRDIAVHQERLRLIANFLRD
jgi:fermentation-respiration switch protein FrsA (DUF1100 family)